MTKPRSPYSHLVGSDPLLEASRRLSARIPHFDFPTFPAVELTARWSESLRPLLAAGERFRKQMEPVTKAFESLRPRLAWWAKEDAKCRRLEKAGWLPHSTSPEIQDQTLSEDDVRIIVEAYYREKWGIVKSAFLKAILDYQIDEEAKETFREALLAHETGLYRCVPRLLFPEIERVSRVQIHACALERIASQDKLREAIGKLTPAELSSAGVYGLRLYFKLSHHLYAHVKDAESLARVLADSTIPNRHATVHGLASYSSFQSSMNALIITDFLFQAISTITRLAEADAEALREENPRADTGSDKLLANQPA
jgi:hypothetical protein